MRRQKNISQIKEQNKASEKKLNIVETNNLLDAEFKTLVKRMLNELSEDPNSIKKTQAEMKFTLSEIKKNLQRISSGVDKAQNQINNMQHMKEKKYSIIISRSKKNPKT